MDKMISYCGLICTDCPAYIATQADDDATREQVAAQWREAFNAPSIIAKSINCDGCLGNTGRKFGHCYECRVRACATDRGMVNCAHCDNYACETLKGFFSVAPQARVTLDGIRVGLAA